MEVTLAKERSISRLNPIYNVFRWHMYLGKRYTGFRRDISFSDLPI